MNQTPSTFDVSALVDEDKCYQTYLRQESVAETNQMFSISANDCIRGKKTTEISSKEGWLLKKSPNKLVGWQKRYVKLSEGKMLYYKGVDEFKGCIDFHLIQVTIHPKVKNNELQEIKLELSGLKKSFQFKCQDTFQLEDWLRCIQLNIQFTQNYPKMIPLKGETMWRFERISENYFRKKADTGDILLFKGQSTLSKLQRAFTRDNYDHVALLLRYNNGELFLFESMGQTGVSLLSWDIFMMNNWHKLYTQLVYRQLDFVRTSKSLQSLESFIKSSIGKKYQMSPSKIIKKFSKSREDIDELDDENKTFFCSELVAAALKKMGVLDQDRCAASYWPGIFAQCAKLTMAKGTFKQEQLIDFSLKI